MSHVTLITLKSKLAVDEVIRDTIDKLVVLRFGRDNDSCCLKVDDVLSKAERELQRMCVVRLVDVDAVPIYTQYFDVSLIPSVVFFFNTIHMKCDYGTQDHSKWVGPFKTKQDLIDLVETMYRGAVRGKCMIQSPIDRLNVPKYDLVYGEL